MWSEALPKHDVGGKEGEVLSRRKKEREGAAVQEGTGFLLGLCASPVDSSAPCLKSPVITLQ